MARAAGTAPGANRRWSRDCPPRPRAGVVRLGVLNLPCALGRGGRRARKREGDGATPVGCWQTGAGALSRRPRPAPRYGVCRSRPSAATMAGAMRPPTATTIGPCASPTPASAERLWRTDRLYDVVVVLSHNTRPRVRGGGSAIFMHVARAGYAPTEGCIALRREHLLAAAARAWARRAALRVLP